MRPPVDLSVHLSGCRPGRVLAVLDPDRSDRHTAHSAAARARSRGSPLTLLCVWRPTRLIGLATLADCDPQSLLEEHAQHAADWAARVLAELPPDMSVDTLCRKGPVGPRVAEELRARMYGELIVDRAVPSRAAITGVIGEYPGVQLSRLSRKGLSRRLSGRG